MRRYWRVPGQGLRWPVGYVGHLLVQVGWGIRVPPPQAPPPPPAQGGAGGQAPAAAPAQLQQQAVVVQNVQARPRGRPRGPYGPYRPRQPPIQVVVNAEGHGVAAAGNGVAINNAPGNRVPNNRYNLRRAR